MHTIGCMNNFQYINDFYPEENTIKPIKHMYIYLSFLYIYIFKFLSFIAYFILFFCLMTLLYTCYSKDNRGAT